MSFPFYHPEYSFSESHPFSERFADSYPMLVNLFLVDRLFQFVYFQRMDYFFFCVDQFFLLFESGLEEFDIYCRVNQSLLRFKHRFFI